jgi:hypothetical protein
VTQTIVLEPGNAWEIPEVELRALAEDVAGGGDELEVDLSYEQSEGAGVTLVEVLHVFLPSADFIKDSAYTFLISALGRHMRRRRDKPHNSQREQVAIIYGPDGEPLREVRLKPGGSEPSDDPVSKSVRRHKPQSGKMSLSAPVEN